MSRINLTTTEPKDKQFHLNIHPGVPIKDIIKILQELDSNLKVKIPCIITFD